MTNAQPSTTPLPLPVSPKTKNRHIDPKLLHAFCEQLSGEICFPSESFPKTTHSIPLTIDPIYFSSLSAQKSHVKPRSHLTDFLSSTSAWHVS
jgi:hypothetical protein